MHALRERHSTVVIGVTLSILFVAVVVPLTAAQNTPSHPLSQIHPSDSNLNFSNNPNAIPYNISGLGAIENFFAPTCPADQAVQRINPDGSYECGAPSSNVGDFWVNETGDTMSGPLDMDGNDILDVGELTGSNIVDSAQISGGAVGDSEIDNSEAFTMAGLTLNGNLSLNGNTITGIGDDIGLGWANLTDYPDACQSGEAIQAVGDTITCVDLTAGGAVDATGGNATEVAYFTDNDTITSNPNLYFLTTPEYRLGVRTRNPTATLDVNGSALIRDNLDLNDSNITNVDVVSAQTIEQGGSTLDTVYVNEDGDTMTDNLNMSGNNITDIGNLVDYFDNQCSGGEFVDNIFSNGTVSCTPVSTATENLSETLEAGNSAGSTNIDLNNNDLVNANRVLTSQLILSNALVDSNVSDTITIDSGGSVNPAAFTRQLLDREVFDNISINASGFVNASAIESRVAGTNLQYNNGVLSVDSTNLDADTLDGQDGSFYVQDLSEVLTQGNVANTSINLSQNNISDVREIQGFFANTCSGQGEVVKRVWENGTYQCVDTVTEETTEAGLPRTLAINNTANTTIDMDGNNIALNGGRLSGDGDDEGVAVDSNGQVGINNNNPQQDLDVDGSVNMSSGGTNMEVKQNGNVVITLGP